VVPGVPEKAPLDRSRDSVELSQSDGLRFARGLAGEFNRSLRFYRDNDTGRIVAEVVDRDSGEVLRKIPPDEVLKLAARMAEAVDIIFGHRGDPARPEPTAAR